MTRSRVRPAPPLAVAHDIDDGLITEPVEEPNGAPEPAAEAAAAEAPAPPAPAVWGARLDRDGSRFGRALTVKFATDSTPGREGRATELVAPLARMVKGDIASGEAFVALVALSKTAAENDGISHLFGGSMASLRQQAEQAVGAIVLAKAGELGDGLFRRRDAIVAGFAEKLADDLNELAGIERALTLLGERRRHGAGAALLDEALRDAGVPAAPAGPDGAA